MHSSEPEVTPAIIGRNQLRVSPWVQLVAKDVCFQPGAAPQTYHCLGLADYVAILAQTPSGLIPVVRQFRPAVEAVTLELPAGLLEPGEDPETCCRRELLEEAGLDTHEVVYLGSWYPDTGRLQNRQHAFFARTSEPVPDFQPEPGVAVEFISLETLRQRICTREFRHQLHIAVLYQYELLVGRAAA